MNLHLLFFLSVPLLSVGSIAAQPVSRNEERAVHNLSAQTEVFPQEKVYVHTDKPYYMAGDTIWLRAHVVDASSHVRTALSKYVYVELRSMEKPAFDEPPSAPLRIRIREREGVYAGYLPLPMTAKSGDYTLTAYTAFMRNAGPDYFFRAPVHVSAYGRRYERQASKRNAERDFDVSFFPEGGYLVEGVPCTLGFKALKPDGNSTFVSCRIVDAEGRETAAAESLHAGMGKVSFTPQHAGIYYAECTNPQGVTKQFRLPAARRDVCVLQIFPASERFSVQVAVPRGYDPGPLALLVHCRGELCYYKDWGASKEHLTFMRNDFPDGVLQFLLLDRENRPLSERLLFCYDEDRQPQVTATQDKPRYGRREKVSLTLDFKDAGGNPLTGDFSVSVTDNRIVASRRPNDIRTSLLLESELRGYVEDPAFYFDEREPARRQAADALMLTQGWRRYDIPAVLLGEYAEPSEPLEIGQEISGRIRKTGIFRKRNFKDYRVSALIPQFGHFAVSEVDAAGRFVLNGFDYPDSTLYVLQAEGPDGRADAELIVDEEDYSGSDNLLPVPDWTARMRNYNDNLSQFTDSLKHILIEEVVISGTPRKRIESPYEVLASSSVDYKKIEQEHYGNLMEALRSKHGVSVRTTPKGDEIFVFGRSATYVIDGIIWEPYEPLTIDPTMASAPLSIETIPSFIPIDMIKRIDIIPPVNSTLFGMRAKGSGVIAITTKNGSELLNEKRENLDRLHMQVLMPLGYQKPAEFYSPKYETPRQRSAPERDLRTTLYWNPAVKISPEGRAVFEFYTADDGADYTLHAEGVVNDIDGTVRLAASSREIGGPEKWASGLDITKNRRLPIR